MLDVVVVIDDGADNQCEFSSGKGDVNCVNCALLCKTPNFVSGIEI
jgi:hypothetical protein